ncbi:hypothetical protein E4T56_gene11599 [Termitomyces sp. T112]|nr:hypothetical protein E4T56_gene11599 [Termitomyces sp. T112]
MVVFSLDTLPAHLSSHLFHTLLLCTILPFSANSIPTLVDSGTTNNFINKSLVVLAPQYLWCLPTSILLKLFDGDSTSARDITHCVDTTVTFANGQQQDFWLLTLHLNQDSLTNSGPVPFDVSLHSKDSEGTNDAPQTLLQLCLKSTCRASSIFISKQLNLLHNTLDKPLKLQLFDASSALAGITQYHDSTLTLSNKLKFQVWLLVTQLPESTPIVLELSWLQDGNPNIN